MNSCPYYNRVPDDRQWDRSNYLVHSTASAWDHTTSNYKFAGPFILFSLSFAPNNLFGFLDLPCWKCRSTVNYRSTFWYMPSVRWIVFHSNYWRGIYLFLDLQLSNLGHWQSISISWIQFPIVSLTLIRSDWCRENFLDWKNIRC